MEFTTDQPFVFRYTFYDVIDENIFEKKKIKNYDWIVERQKLTDLTISEAKSKNNGDNKISITFKPNYKYSTTRYIIIIAQKNERNTIENFKDLCFVADLLNQRPEGVKVDYIYEASEESDTEVNAEVDISSIVELAKEQNFIINIIGQELRFEKQINLYTPKEFKHTGKEKSEDDQEEGGKPSGGDQEGGDDSGDSGEKGKDSGSNSTSLAFVIVTPILGVIIIILVVMVILAHKRASSSRSEEIERLT